MTEKEAEAIAARIIGINAYRALFPTFDFTHCVYCRESQVEEVAALLRSNRSELHYTLTRVSGLSPGITTLPHCICLERTRSLIIPRPLKVAPRDLDHAVKWVAGAMVRCPPRPLWVPPTTYSL